MGELEKIMSQTKGNILPLWRVSFFSRNGTLLGSKRLYAANADMAEKLCEAICEHDVRVHKLPLPYEYFCEKLGEGVEHA
jgi:hypothetical protein